MHSLLGLRPTAGLPAPLWGTPWAALGPRKAMVCLDIPLEWHEKWHVRGAGAEYVETPPNTSSCVGRRYQQAGNGTRTHNPQLGKLKSRLCLGGPRCRKLSRGAGFVAGGPEPACPTVSQRGPHQWPPKWPPCWSAWLLGFWANWGLHSYCRVNGTVRGHTATRTTNGTLRAAHLAAESAVTLIRARLDLHRSTFPR